MIAAISVVIAVLGVLLLAILFLSARTLINDLKLKKHRAKDEGLADLLNYAAAVDDGIILCKSGSLMAAWLYEGADNASSMEVEREDVSLRINKALASLGSGWMVHVDAVRRPSPGYPDKSASSFPDPLSAAIDEERRQQFEAMGNVYQGYFVLTATWSPPTLVQSKFIELMVDDDAERRDETARTIGILAQFKTAVAGLESSLSAVLRLTRLRGHKIKKEGNRETTHDDFLSWLQFCVTGDHHPVQLPSNPICLDAIIGGQELWTGLVPKIGTKYIQVVAIQGFPLESSPGMLSKLAELPCECRWSSRFIFVDPHESLAHFEKLRRGWGQKVRPWLAKILNTNTGPINQDALMMVGDAESAMAEINSGLVAAGYYTSVVVLMDEDREQLAANALWVKKTVDQLGFAARVESLNTLEAYLGSLPGHGFENLRRPLINTLNLADLLPTSSIWLGKANSPCPMYPPETPALMHCMTIGASPFRLNLHVGDVGHTIMLGPTGAGKSVHLAMIAAQLRRYASMSVYVFDNGMSLYPLTAAIHASSKGKSGLHFDISADGKRLAFCPLQFLETESDRAWAFEWIETIFALNGLDCTPLLRRRIGEAIESMHASGKRTLHELKVLFQDESVRDVLKHYTVGGAMGHLLDAEQDGLSLSDFTVFEMKELMALDKKFALPVLLYLFRRIERSMRGQPGAIILDESWVMLGHEVFSKKVREWLKVLRKSNFFVLMATQSLSDATNSGILDVILESTATKIFLPNIHAREADAAALYARMGLNEREVEILATAIPKRQYYYASASGRRLYELALGPLALSFVGVSDAESISRIKHLEAKFGHAWPNEWLVSRGVNLGDYLWELEAT